MRKEKNIGFLSFTARKGLLGLLLGTIVLYICVRYYNSPSFGAAFALLFILPGFFRLNVRNKNTAFGLQVAFGLISLAVCCGAALFVLRNLFYEKGLFDLEALKLFCNFLFAFVVCCLLIVITANWAWSVSLASLIVIVAATVDGFVIQFRGREISMNDILSVGTAMSVAGEYTYYVPAYMAFCIMLWAALVFTWFSLPRFPRKGGLRRRAVAIAATVIAFASMHFLSRDIRTYYWGVDGSVNNGLYLNLYLGVRDSFVKAPENYSPEKAEALVADLASGEVDIDGSKLPNILVIMNESFGDFAALEKRPEFSVPLTPYLDSLGDDLISGNTLCSVYGGNTANSEFEFLMGHTMAFFPNSATVVPYQQYLDGEIYSLPQLMKSLGYDTMATHPYKSSGWLRDRLYPNFGFSESSFIDDYPQQKLVRNYVSDQEMYEYVLEKLCDPVRENPLFLFGITMQNHGGYNYEGDNYEKTVELVGCEGSYPMAEQYFTLINESDRALGYLIEHLKAFEENTVLLFFGDHLPRVEEQFYTELNGSPIDTLEEQMCRHTVPFYIWANYDISEYEVELTSLNYLSRYLLEAAGIPLPAYYDFLRETETTIPAINAYGYYSLSKAGFASLDEAEDEEAQALENYRILQYNNVFDGKNRSETAFSAYMYN